MAETKHLPVRDLQLDLHNFRTVAQKSEPAALRAMVSTAPKKFWALTASLLDSGYLPTENIIVLENAKGYHVREGNRRIAALKFIDGKIANTGFAVPPEIEEKIKKVSPKWRKANATVPCAIYSQSDETLVDRIVTLAHGKGEDAARDDWNSLAGARHNRDKNGAVELGLDLLEKYLENGNNLTAVDKEYWSGVYPVTLLNEVLGKIAQRMGFNFPRDLVAQYPKLKDRKVVETILKAIGDGNLTFPKVRDKQTDFAESFGLPPQSQKGAVAKSSSPTGTISTGSKSGPRAISSRDPASVMRTLRQFAPKGKGRDKVATLLDEMRKLKLDKHPYAFCFLLRAMFELSAKAYFVDNQLSTIIATKKGTRDKTLADMLRDATAHMTAGKPKTDPIVKSLHGAMTELGKKDGLLSVYIDEPAGP